MKVDLQLGDSIPGAPARARELETLGADGVFSFEGGHDVFFPLVTAAPACSLDLMTNIAIAFPRSPHHLANAAYDLQQLSEGRFRLGVGSQVKAHVERRFGSTWGSPVKHMREWIEATKAILEHWQHGTPLDFKGEYTQHTLAAPNFNPGPNPHGIAPVLVGALGPRMNEMAAEVADGVLVMPFNSGLHMRERTVPAIERGLAKSGRTFDDYEIIVEVIVGVGRTDEELEAARAVRNLVAFYASTPAYRPVLEVHSWGDAQTELHRLTKAGEWGSMGAVITDDMLETIAVCGTPKECAEKIHDRYGEWADRVCTYFPFYDATDDLIAELVDELHKVGS